MTLCHGNAGAGKSSLVGLLLRLVECTAGRILIDGHDIARVHLRKLRKSIGLVPQTPFLFEVSTETDLIFTCTEHSVSLDPLLFFFESNKEGVHDRNAVPWDPIVLLLKDQTAELVCRAQSGTTWTPCANSLTGT